MNMHLPKIKYFFLEFQQKPMNKYNVLKFSFKGVFLHVP